MSYSRPIGNIGLIILRDMLDVHIILSAVHPYFAAVKLNVMLTEYKLFEVLQDLAAAQQ